MSRLVVWSGMASLWIWTSAKPHAGGRIRCSGMSWRSCLVARLRRYIETELWSVDRRCLLRALIPTLHMRTLAKPCPAFVFPLWCTNQRISMHQLRVDGDLLAGPCQSSAMAAVSQPADGA